MNFFSDSDIRTIQNDLRLQKRHLELMKEDKSRAMTGRQLVPAVDLSEIYSNIHKNSPNTKYGYALDGLLSGSSTPCVFLPPWLWELMEFMRQKALDLKNHFENDAVKRFLSSVPPTEDPDEFRETYIKMNGLDFYMQLVSKQGLAQIIEEPMNKLIDLYKREKIVGPERFVDIEDLKVDPTIYSMAYGVLRGLRPGRKKRLSNKFDAYAYAMVYKLNQIYQDKYYFYVITHSDNPFKTFKTIIWQEDPLKQGLSLVRHPIYQLEVVKLAKILPRESDQVEFIKEGITLISHLIDDIEQVPILEKKLRKTTDTKERASIKKELLIKLGRLRAYDERYYTTIFQPIQRNLKKLLGVDPLVISPKEAYSSFLKNGFEIGAEDAFERIRDKTSQLYEVVSQKTRFFDPTKIDRQLLETLRWLRKGGK